MPMVESAWFYVTDSCHVHWPTSGMCAKGQAGVLSVNLGAPCIRRFFLLCRAIYWCSCMVLVLEIAAKKSNLSEAGWLAWEEDLPFVLPP